MYKVEVVKIGGHKHNVPLHEPIRGRSPFLPKIGENYMVSKDTDGDFMLITTKIEHVEQIGNEYRFQTQNSLYKVVILEEVQ